MKKIVTDEQIIKSISECCSMAMAAKNVGMSFMSFRRRAKALGLYKPNQGGKGIKDKNNKRIPIQEILDGLHPEFQTYKLKLRLIDEGIFDDKCSICGWDKKLPNMKYTPCELHHIDGNPRNHKKENLQILCPNCHSLTENYCFRVRNVIESQDEKSLGEKESNSVKPLDNGNAEPSLRNKEGVET